MNRLFGKSLIDKALLELLDKVYYSSHTYNEALLQVVKNRVHFALFVLRFFRPQYILVSLSSKSARNLEPARRTPKSRA